MVPSDKNHVPWGRLSLWKWVPGISPGVKVAVAFGWWPTTLVVPKVEKIRGLNLPGTPRATSACRGIPLLLLFLYCSVLYHDRNGLIFGLISANYIQWRLVMALGKDSTQKLRELAFHFDTVYSGTKEKLPLWVFHWLCCLSAALMLTIWVLCHPFMFRQVAGMCVCDQRYAKLRCWLFVR